jgi:NMD protein affecting ribosome stability and mRNA decay
MALENKFGDMTLCTHCGDPLPESTVEPGLCVECKAVFDREEGV